MLTLIAIIGIVLFILSIYFLYDTREDGWCGGILGGAFVGFGVLIVVFVGVIILATSPKIDQEIEMYTEENYRLETQIDNAVEQYLKHEEKFYDLDKIDPNILFIVLPELNSSELVKSQVEVYINNNNKIKE